MDKIKLDLTQTKALKCDNCGGESFIEALHLRRVSALLTGTGQPGVYPIPVFACTKCGHVNEEFLPKEIKQPKLD
jgi:uncharacterized Zn finger protein